MEHVSKKISLLIQKCTHFIWQEKYFCLQREEGHAGITLPKREMVSGKITAHLWIFRWASKQDTAVPFWIFL